MGFIATSHGVTLIHHHGLHFASVSANDDVVETPTFLVKPTGRECHNWYVIRMEFFVTFRWTSAISILLEAVESEICLGMMSDWW